MFLSVAHTSVSRFRTNKKNRKIIVFNGFAILFVLFAEYAKVGLFPLFIFASVTVQACLPCRDSIRDDFISSSLPSIDKGKHACQRVFPALFALFALAGASPPAAQKPKITRRSIAGRCGQFCRSRNVSRQGKARREYCRIVKGLDAVWAHFCPAKPCLPSSIDGTVCDQIRKPTVQTRPRTALSMHSASAGSQSRVFIICTSGFVLRSVMPVSIWLICAAPTSVIAASHSCVRFFR